MKQKLSNKQEKVLRFITAHISRHGYPPTVREIACGLGMSGPNSAKKLLDILERKGRIRRAANSARAIEVIPPDNYRHVRAVPVAGTIHAGSPVFAFDAVSERIALDASFVPSEDMFLLTVEGDSMIEAHITTGDLALVKPQAAIEQGAIAAVRIGDEATIKYLFRERYCIRLEPANRNMPVLRLDESSAEVHIIGKVVGILRKIP